MIHVRTSRAPSPDSQKENIIHFSLRGDETIAEFKALLDRALNCLPPQLHKEWVEVSDRIEKFLAPASEDTQKPPGF